MRQKLLLMEHNIKIACSKENLKEVRRFVNNALQQFPLTESDVNMLTLAVDEVCANLIIHSHKCNPNESIDLKIFEKDKGIVFEITDEGESFNLLNHEEKSLDQIVQEKKKGGLGIMLVKRIMDDIQILNSPSHNICRLYKKIS